MSVPAEKKEDKLPGFESLEELLDCINAEAPEMVERGLTRFVRQLRRERSELLEDWREHPAELTELDPQRRVDKKALSLGYQYLLSSPEGAELITLLGDAAGRGYKVLTRTCDALAALIYLPKPYKVSSSASSSSSQSASFVNAQIDNIITTISKRFVRNNVSVLYRLLSADDTRILSPALRMLKALTARGVIIARLLTSKFNFAFKGLLSVPYKASKKQNLHVKQARAVRNMYIELIIALLRVNDAAVTRHVVNVKGFVSAVFKELNNDPLPTVQQLMESLKMNLLDHPGLSPWTKLTFFSTYILEQLIRLYDAEDDEYADASHQLLLHIINMIGSSAQPLPTSLFSFTPSSLSSSSSSSSLSSSSSTGQRKRSDKSVSVPSSGKAITPRLLKTTGNDKVSLNTLSRLLSQLKANQDLKQQQLLLSILTTFPTLVSTYMNKLSSSQSFDPRPSFRWMANVALLHKLYHLPVHSYQIHIAFSSLTNSRSSNTLAATHLTSSSSGSGGSKESHYIQQVLQQLRSSSRTDGDDSNAKSRNPFIHYIIPSSLTKNMLTQGIKHKSPMVQYNTLNLIVVIFKRMRKLIQGMKVYMGIQGDIDQLSSSSSLFSSASHASSSSPSDAKRKLFIVLVNSLRNAMRLYLPDLQVIFGLKSTLHPYANSVSNKSGSSSSNGNANAEISEAQKREIEKRNELMFGCFLKVLHSYQRCLPELFQESRIDIWHLVSPFLWRLPADSQMVVMRILTAAAGSLSQRMWSGCKSQGKKKVKKKKNKKTNGNGNAFVGDGSGNNAYVSLWSFFKQSSSSSSSETSEINANFLRNLPSPLVSFIRKIDGDTSNSGSSTSKNNQVPYQLSHFGCLLALLVVLREQQYYQHISSEDAINHSQSALLYKTLYSYLADRLYETGIFESSSSSSSLSALFASPASASSPAMDADSSQDTVNTASLLQSKVMTIISIYLDRLTPSTVLFFDRLICHTVLNPMAYSSAGNTNSNNHDENDRSKNGNSNGNNSVNNASLKSYSTPIISNCLLRLLMSRTGLLFDCLSTHEMENALHYTASVLGQVMHLSHHSGSKLAAFIHHMFTTHASDDSTGTNNNTNNAKKRKLDGNGKAVTKAPSPYKKLILSSPQIVALSEFADRLAHNAIFDSSSSPSSPQSSSTASFTQVEEFFKAQEKKEQRSDDESDASTILFSLLKNMSKQEFDQHLPQIYQLCLQSSSLSSISPSSSLLLSTSAHWPLQSLCDYLLVFTTTPVFALASVQEALSQPGSASPSLQSLLSLCSLSMLWTHSSPRGRFSYTQSTHTSQFLLQRTTSASSSLSSTSCVLHDYPSYCMMLLSMLHRLKLDIARAKKAKKNKTPKRKRKRNDKNGSDDTTDGVTDFDGSLVTCAFATSDLQALRLLLSCLEDMVAAPWCLSNMSSSDNQKVNQSIFAMKHAMLRSAVLTNHGWSNLLPTPSSSSSSLPPNVPKVIADSSAEMLLLLTSTRGMVGLNKTESPLSLSSASEPSSSSSVEFTSQLCEKLCLELDNGGKNISLPLLLLRVMLNSVVTTSSLQGMYVKVARSILNHRGTSSLSSASASSISSDLSPLHRVLIDYLPLGRFVCETLPHESIALLTRVMMMMRESDSSSKGGEQEHMISNVLQLVYETILRSSSSSLSASNSICLDPRFVHFCFSLLVQSSASSSERASLAGKIIALLLQHSHASYYLQALTKFLAELRSSSSSVSSITASASASSSSPLTSVFEALMPALSVYVVSPACDDELVSWVVKSYQSQLLQYVLQAQTQSADSSDNDQDDVNVDLVLHVVHGLIRSQHLSDSTRAHWVRAVAKVNNTGDTNGEGTSDGSVVKIKNSVCLTPSSLRLCRLLLLNDNIDTNDTRDEGENGVESVTLFVAVALKTLTKLYKDSAKTPASAASLLAFGDDISDALIAVLVRTRKTTPFNFNTMVSPSPSSLCLSIAQLSTYVNRFIKACLKYQMRHGPALRLLMHLLPLYQSNTTSNDIGVDQPEKANGGILSSLIAPRVVLGMMVSHSDFVDFMLSSSALAVISTSTTYTNRQNPCFVALRLIQRLLQTRSVLSRLHAPSLYVSSNEHLIDVLFAMYGGTLSPLDRRIKAVLCCFREGEENDDSDDEEEDQRTTKQGISVLFGNWQRKWGEAGKLHLLSSSTPSASASASSTSSSSSSSSSLFSDSKNMLGNTDEAASEWVFLNVNVQLCIVGPADHGVDADDDVDDVVDFFNTNTKTDRVGSEAENKDKNAMSDDDSDEDSDEDEQSEDENEDMGKNTTQPMFQLHYHRMVRLLITGHSAKSPSSSSSSSEYQPAHWLMRHSFDANKNATTSRTSSTTAIAQTGYDPLFFLAFLNHWTQQANINYRKFIESGFLAYTIRCLSHPQRSIRKAAYIVIAHVYDALVTSSALAKKRRDREKGSDDEGSDSGSDSDSDSESDSDSGGDGEPREDGGDGKRSRRQIRKDKYRKLEQEKKAREEKRANGEFDETDAEAKLGESLKTFMEQPQILLLLTLLKSSITSKWQHVPTLITSFLVKTLPILLQPHHFLYKAINRFLIQRPQLDLNDVPMFYELFNGGGEHHRQYRSWSMQMLVDLNSVTLKKSTAASAAASVDDEASSSASTQVTRSVWLPMDASSVAALHRRHALPILLSYFGSGISDSYNKKLILRLLVRLVHVSSSTSGDSSAQAEEEGKVPVCWDLVLKEGLLSWISSHFDYTSDYVMNANYRLVSGLSSSAVVDATAAGGVAGAGAGTCIQDDLAETMDALALVQQIASTLTSSHKAYLEHVEGRLEDEAEEEEEEEDDEDKDEDGDGDADDEDDEDAAMDGKSKGKDKGVGQKNDKLKEKLKKLKTQSYRLRKCYDIHHTKHSALMQQVYLLLSKLINRLVNHTQTQTNNKDKNNNSSASSSAVNWEAVDLSLAVVSSLLELMSSLERVMQSSYEAFIYHQQELRESGESMGISLQTKTSRNSSSIDGQGDGDDASDASKLGAFLAQLTKTRSANLSCSLPLAKLLQLITALSSHKSASSSSPSSSPSQAQWRNDVLMKLVLARCSLSSSMSVSSELSLLDWSFTHVNASLTTCDSSSIILNSNSSSNKGKTNSQWEFEGWLSWVQTLLTQLASSSSSSVLQILQIQRQLAHMYSIIFVSASSSAAAEMKEKLTAVINAVTLSLIIPAYEASSSAQSQDVLLLKSMLSVLLQHDLAEGLVEKEGVQAWMNQLVSLFLQSCIAHRNASAPSSSSSSSTSPSSVSSDLHWLYYLLSAVGSQDQESPSKKKKKSKKKKRKSLGDEGGLTAVVSQFPSSSVVAVVASKICRHHNELFSQLQSSFASSSSETLPSHPSISLLAMRVVGRLRQAME